MASTSSDEQTRQKWDKNSMKMAIMAIKDHKMGFLKASKTYGVPKTTLIRLCKNEHNLPLQELTNIKLGRKATLPNELETELAKYVLEMEDAGFGLTRRDIMSLAFQLAEKNKLPHNFSSDKQSAGKTWLRLFLKRHPNLSFRQPTGTSIARMKGFNKENVNGFYTLLEEAMDSYKYTASNIYNVDETGITVVPSKMPEVLAKKGKRQIKATTSAERGSTVTCVVCMSASGSFVPPMMIFPRKRDHPLLMKGAPPGAIHACHPSGWIQTDLFTQWFKHFLLYVKPSASSPVLLILDGHASHTRNIEVIDLARANNVQLLSLPPHSSHKIQPLDRTFMGPLKKYFTEETRQFVRNNTRAATHYDIAEIFGRAYVKAQRAELAINGFRVTGIFPVDRNVFQDHDFIDEQDDQSAVEQDHSIQQVQSNARMPSAISDNDSDDHDSDHTLFDDSEPLPTVRVLQCRNEEILDNRAQSPLICDAVTRYLAKPESPISKATYYEVQPMEVIKDILPIAVSEVPRLSTLALAKYEQFREQKNSAVDVAKIPSLSETKNNVDSNVSRNSNLSKDTTYVTDIPAIPSTSYLSPKHISPVPRIKVQSSNRGRKATKSTFLTASPYKLELQTSKKIKEEAESLKKNRNLKKELNKLKGSVETMKRSRSKRKIDQKSKKNAGGKRKKNKLEIKKTKEMTKKLKISTSSSEDGNYSVNDDTDESTDRQDNAKCFYCNGLFSEDMAGEQWVQCPSCQKWAHDACAGVEGSAYICEFCS